MPWRKSVEFIIAVVAIALVGGCGDKGTRVTKGGGKAAKTVEVTSELPSDYPADAPRYPGWTVKTVTRSSTRRHKTLTVSASSPDPYEQVVKRLKAMAEKSGWKRNSGGNIDMPGVSTVAAYYKGWRRTARLLMFQVSPRAGKTYIVLVVPFD